MKNSSLYLNILLSKMQWSILPVTGKLLSGNMNVSFSASLLSERTTRSAIGTARREFLLLRCDFRARSIHHRTEWHDIIVKHNHKTSINYYRSIDSFNASRSPTRSILFAWPLGRRIERYFKWNRRQKKRRRRTRNAEHVDEIPPRWEEELEETLRRKWEGGE